MFKATDVLTPDSVTRKPAELWAQISPLYSIEEDRWLSGRLPLIEPAQDELANAACSATTLIERIHSDDDAIQMIDALNRDKLSFADWKTHLKAPDPCSSMPPPGGCC